MGYRDRLKKIMDSKRAEIDRLERELVAAKAYLQGLNESMRLLPKDDEDEALVKTEETVPKTGASADKARDLIQKEGRLMHVNEIVVGIGLENSRKNRVSVAGSLWRYAKKGEIFIKAGPNTFGLKGMEELSRSTKREPDLPIEFGKH